jgi:hypothetical protein
MPESKKETAAMELIIPLKTEPLIKLNTAATANNNAAIKASR